MTRHGFVVGLLVAVVSVGAFGAQAPVGDVSGVLAWIPHVRTTPEYDNVVTVLGARPAETRTTDPAELERLLAGKSVLLIPEQHEADAATLERLGKAVEGVLKGFLGRNGRIVGMTFADGAEDILRGAGIWSCDDAFNLTEDDLAVAVAGHPLAAGVAATFEGPSGSTDFRTMPPDAVVVVWDPRDEAPVVFQWNALGGTIVMLGFDFFAYNDATAAILRNAVGLAPPPVTLGPPGPEATAVLTSVTVSDVEGLLTELGLTFERRTDEYGDPLWVFEIEGITVVLSVDDETAGLSGRYQFLMLYAGWIAEGRVSLAVVNDWNLQKRGSRAYLDRDQDPVIESDLYLHGGVTRDTIRQFIERFGRSAADFRSHIGAD
jgi:hypothetical protein